MDQTLSTNVYGSLQGCKHIFAKGKNKGNHCGCIVKKDNLCSKHKKNETPSTTSTEFPRKTSAIASVFLQMDNNLQKYGNYGNPDQAELWVKWINSVD